jgi:hypothetical protein
MPLACNVLSGARFQALHKSREADWSPRYTKVRFICGCGGSWPTIFSKENTMSMPISSKSDFLPVSSIQAISTKIWSFANTSPITGPKTSLNFATRLSREIPNVSNLLVSNFAYLLKPLKVAMLYVEKDLSATVKGIFDQWDSKKNELNHKILYCTDARVSAGDIIECIERGIVANSQNMSPRLKSTSDR